MALTRDEILTIAREEGVKFIRLQFTDLTGQLKNVAITVEQLPKALDGELMFDGSSIEGFVRIEESDMYLRPDPDTFVILPWQQRDGGSARLVCDVYSSDGTPFSGCPRGQLKRMLELAARQGYTMNCGPEAEFFLFHTNNDEAPTLHTHDQGDYFDLAPTDRGETARQEMVLRLEEMGFSVEASHHEGAPGQHEIDFEYSDALTTADNLATFKYIVRLIAQRHGLYATFMPKPLTSLAGSGMHTHISLFKKDKNAFYDPAAGDGLSETARGFMAGLLEHARAYTVVTCPLVNSYKRLVPGYRAPVDIAWSYRNRSPLVRIPARRGTGTRVELRNPDPSCNPYLAFGVILRAGLDGIQRKVSLPEPVDTNIYNMTAAEKKARGIERLPESLYQAVQELDRSSLIKEALGEHIYNRFREGRMKEWEDYRIQVHEWEVKQYLARF